MTVNKKNRCHYKRINGKWEIKKEYNTFFDALKTCRQINIQQSIEFKIIPYYCKICNKIHIGKDIHVLNDLNEKVINNINSYF